MDHQQIMSSPIQPIYSNMDTHSRFYHQEEGAFVDAKATSSTRSPTTVYSVDELSSVFRVPDDAVERSNLMLGPSINQEKESGSTSTGVLRQRSLTPSLTTDAELSTFSQESEETDDDEDIILRFPAIRRRRASPLNSIFRPVSGSKRRCEFEESDEDDCPSPAAKRSCSAPMLCRAGPIGSDSGSEDGYDEPSPLFSSSSFSSPFQRICRSSPIFENTSTFTSLFANEAQPAIMGTQAEANTVSIMPAVQLQHPLSYDTAPVLKLKASSFIIRGINAKVQGEEHCDKEC